jgi:hypothetical protein
MDTGSGWSGGDDGGVGDIWKSGTWKDREMTKQDQRLEDRKECRPFHLGYSDDACIG